MHVCVWITRVLIAMYVKGQSSQTTMMYITHGRQQTSKGTALDGEERRVLFCVRPQMPVSFATNTMLKKKHIPV